MGAGCVPYLAFTKARITDILAMSSSVMDEVVDVINRPVLARYFNPVLRDDLLDRLRTAAVWFDPGVTVTDCRDPADNKYSELALASAASIIVSGDRDLLVLNPWRGVHILQPAAWLIATRTPPPPHGTG